MIAADVADLVALFDRSDLTELSIEQHGRSLFLRKGELAASTAPPPEAEAPAVPEQATVKAHRVGRFYWAKDKRGTPLVEGQRVEKGQVVGWVESMGIMNEVEAPEAGTLATVAIEAGKPVEYGQALAVIAPD